MSPSRSVFAASLDDAVLEECFDLIGARTGLQVRAKDRALVARALSARFEALKISAPDFVQILRNQKTGEGEWALLMPTLTNGESYFQRDKGQFELLRTTIVPELIERRREAGQHTLRLWSAGCSTGEEAYSLAMTVEPLLPRAWNLLVLGTDINSEALQKAKRAVYGSWSFRGVEDTTRDVYFRPLGGGFEVAPALRERVLFEFCNLSANDWPDASRGIADMDLILCRNVLIYFAREAVAGVVERFARTLRPGGCLLTGHAELHDQNVAPLRARLFPESAVYQKEMAIGTKSVVALPTPPRSTATGLQPLGSVALSSGIQPRTAPARTAKTAAQWCEEARVFADGGQSEAAIACCRGAIDVDPSCLSAYLLWARVEEEAGRLSQTKELLKKVIYLAPSHPEAYLELGVLYEREGDAGRARQMRVSALELLRHLPPDHTLLSQRASVRELISYVQNLLSRGAQPMPGERR